MVGSPAALTPGDAAVRARLQAAGHTVVVADDNTVTVEAAAATTFVMITSSVTDSVLKSRLSGLSTPIWVAKPYLFDNYGLAGPTGEVDYGSRATRTITVVAPDHPLAAGLTGTVNFQTGSSRVTWARAAASAAVVATTGTDATIFTIDAGQPLAGWPAGARLPDVASRSSPTRRRRSRPPAGRCSTPRRVGGRRMRQRTGRCSADVTITAPAGGSTVSGTTPVTASATDDVGVTAVGFAVDGTSIGNDTDGSDGWTAAWDTTGVADGTHVVSATATDTAGQTTTTNLSVTVANSPPSADRPARGRRRRPR